MRGLRMCISCVVLATDRLSLHWERLAPISGSTFFLKRFIVAWGKQALAVSGRCCVRDENGVLDSAHGNPSTSTRHISLQEEDFLRQLHRLPSVTRSCIPVPCTASSRGARGTNISLCSFLYEVYTRLCTPLDLRSLARHEGKFYARISDLRRPNSSHSDDFCRRRTRTSIVCQGLTLKSREACVQAVFIMRRSFNLLTSLQHTNMTYLWSAVKWRLENAASGRIWFLSSQQES
jgi:hypothetical protein